MAFGGNLDVADQFIPPSKQLVKSWETPIKNKDLHTMATVFRGIENLRFYLQNINLKYRSILAVLLQRQIGRFITEHLMEGTQGINKYILLYPIKEDLLEVFPLYLQLLKPTFLRIFPTSSGSTIIK